MPVLSLLLPAPYAVAAAAANPAFVAPPTPGGEANGGKIYFFPKGGTPLPRAVRVGDAAYWVGKPRVLMAADVDDLHVSPDRRYILAICRDPQREPFETEAGGNPLMKDVAALMPFVMRPCTGTISLLLFDTSRARASVLWKRETGEDERVQLDSLSWLADNKTALARLSLISLLPEAKRMSGGKEETYRPESVETFLLMISASRRSASPLPLLGKNGSVPMVQIVPSPTDNRALITVVPEYGGASQFRFLSADGVLTEPRTQEINFSFLSGWTADGRITGFAMPNARSGWPKDEMTRSISVDGRTGEITFGKMPDPKAMPVADKTTTPEISEAPGANASPVVVFSQPASLTTPGLAGRPAAVSPVLLRSATDEKESVLLAPDGDPVGVVGTRDNLTVLYRANDALYAVTLHKTSRAVYETALRVVARQRAGKLQMALGVWKLQHDNQFPNLGADVATLIAVDINMTRFAPDESFRDPATGKTSFAYLYHGSDGEASVPLFSLSTLDGRYVLYTTGYRPHWVPNGTPVPATEPKPGDPATDE